MDIIDIHNLFLKCTSVSIDTRKIGVNSFFVAIKGDNFNANTFAREALDKGASYVLIDDEDYFIDERTILVNNSLATLQQLAKFHRNYLKLPIIALTGSNGKTTTKELINAVLSKKFKTKATVGNLNNHIGVPLTLLSFDAQTEIGIVEMGANHKKEIEFLCEIAQPDYGYITNFGKAHLEGFGGVEGVIQGKSEMYHYLSKYDKLAFVNFEDDIQVEKTSKIKAFSFGINNKIADVNIDHVEADPFVTVSYLQNKITTHLIGLYNANNVNAAIAIGIYFGVKNEAIKQALEAYIPENNRSQLITRGTNEIILDAYNANPSSMKVAIENFILLKKVDKILFLGDMFELGEESIIEHKGVLDLLINQDTIKCYFIGKDFYKNRISKTNFFFFDNFENFAEAIKDKKFENNIILIKGSRGMALERTLELI
ncbi:UDP-N-acetylmuramoyl-tripeptide--D-alanyl-D-alanine ligase [Flavobacterium aestuarii]|uniref:UDP-N-acetylmuramoyl-tripeptide--D-alanyl-D- alanine ligase n=1 Tax=Flavobacterium aestuarii TaxID=3149227 RepID=UPI0032B3810A